MKIVGISGTDASGKDSTAEFLVQKNWLFVSVTDLLRDEANKKGIPLSRQTLRQISAQWRREFGMAVLIEKAVQKFDSKKGKYEGLVVASLRHPAEADKVHELGGKVIWTDAEPRIRYERILSRNRGAEDHISFEEFLKEEQIQMQPSGDEATLNLSGVKAKADIFIENDGNDLQVLKVAAQKALAPYLTKA